MPPSPSDLPGLAELLALECQARRQGSGLVQSDLLGIWTPERIWRRAERQGSPLAEALLRGLGATLRIEAAADGEGLRLSNAVRLGPLGLCFREPARLEGRRPLLLFRPERLEISAGERLLLSRPLAQPQMRRQPFLALIACGPQGSWLAARGRSGGLAVWRRAS